MTKFIDFNNLAAGTVVDNEFSSQGVTISATGGSNQAMIFNTAQPTGEDSDLGTTNLNGALIISEDGNRNDPDDNQGGGTFTFTFDDTASVNRLTFLDIEEGATVRFFGENGKLISSVNVQATSDNGQIIQDFDVDGVARMEVTLNGSGAIDNLVFDDTGLDGVVEGSNDDDVIDAGFDGDVDGDRIDANDQILPGEGRDDDIVDALGGDDRILSGNGDDEVFAGSGDDTVDGGAGDDVIFGDSNYAGPGAGTTVRESFEWDLAGSNNGQNIGGFTQDTGNVNVTFSVQQSASADTEFASNNQNIANIDADGAPVDDNSSLSSELSGNGASADYRVDFSAPVENVSFRVNDIDVSSVVRIKAFDAAGNPIVVNLEGGSNLTLTDTDTVTGNDTADGNGGNLPDTAPEFSVLVSIAGPVARIEIEHDQVGNGNSGVNITDVYFDAVVVDDGAAGDDSLSGGDGDDTIFGEDGNDTLRGGDGDDSLVGGANNDSLVGGNGDDVLDGGFGRDTLFGGNGNDTAFGGNGADEIWVGGGNDSVDGGANDDWIHGQSGNDTLNGDGGDDMIFGEDGNDVLAGGSGNDTLDGGANADTIFGGAGDVVDGGAGGFSNNPAQNTDLDVLDLTGQGAFFLDNVTPDSNGNGIDGTVVFVDANGNPTGETIVFTEIEEVIGDVFNRGPDAVNDTAEVDEDGSVDIDVLGNDVDPDGDALTVVDASSPDGDVTINPDGTITFTPNENFNGDTTITYTVTDPDGAEDTATVSVTVNAVNDDPVAVDDVASTDEDTAVIVDLIGNDTDVDGDPLTIGTVSVPADQGEVVDNGDGTVTFTPAPDFNGEATITYTVIDGNGGEDEGQAIVTVGAVNDGPVANDDTAEVDEDGSVDIPVLGNDTDLDGDDLRVIEASSPDGEVTINPDGTITFAPAENFNGDTTITYTITDDNGGTDTATVNVTVNPVNDAPVAVDDADTTPFDTPVTIDVLGNDTDVDGDDLRVIAATSPNGDVEINPDGTLTFTPTPGFEGEAIIDYTITDDNGGQDSAQVTVLVEDQPLDGIVSGTEAGELIDEDFLGDPEGDRVDNNDEILLGEGPNDDIIQAGGGDDTIIAGEGNDDVFAGTGDDQVLGGSGDDILRGEEGADTINGGAGDDTIEGGDDDDVINGGDGADSVLGGTGNDVIDTSNDLFAPDLGFPNDDGTPAPGFPFGFAADDDPEDDRDFVDGGEGDDTISTGDDADTIIGGSGDDVIDGGIDADEITGDDGADRIVGGEGSDVIDGGEGDDTIFAGNDPDLGLDQLNIEDDGSNPLFPADPVPNNGMDTVFGGEGNDIIFGADDDDQLFGEEGNDTIDGEVDDDFIDGGIGDDSLLGGQGNDTILGGDGDDFIDGGGQADTVDGGEGSDTIIGGNGADVLNGGAGDDFIDGGTGDDTLNGDDGDDFITGATGDDVIDGGAGNDTIDGGNGGNDIMSGGDDRDTFINVNAGEVVDGDEGGDDFDTLDLRGAAPGGGSLNIVFDAGNPENGVVNFFDTNGEAAGSLTFSNIENIIPCFTPGTMIATPQGERRVEDLIVGDRVITRDNGIQEIRWVGKRHMSGEELAAAQHLRPVLIRQGALGRGLPERDMLVSPQHRVLMSSDKTELYFDESEVLVAAKHLTDMDGIDVVDASATTYIHVMFDQHEVILSDGAWTESFQPGDQTLASMGAAQRAEILELFPELETEVGIEAYTAARRSLKKHEAKLLTQ